MISEIIHKDENRLSIQFECDTEMIVLIKKFMENTNKT